MTLASRTRNVLLIVVDQWRGDCLGRLGAGWVKTPNLDALAARGVSFARHFCQGAPCAPARASIHTGKYVMNHRVVHNGVPLDARHDHLARILRRAGLDPALIGYTTTTPDPRGLSPDDYRFKRNADIADSWRLLAQFDEIRYPDGVAAWVAGNYAAWVAASDSAYAGRSADELWAQRSGAARPDGSPCVVPAALSDNAWLAGRALEFLRSQPAGESWFLHLGFYRPHPPFTAPDPYHQATPLAAVPAPVRAARREDEGAGHPYLAHLHATQRLDSFLVGGEGMVSSLTDDEIRLLRQGYYGLIAEVDAQIGRVIEALRADGRLDGTLIVFTSDHAEQLGDHHLFGKVGFFDQSYHVPLIVVDPSAAADATRGRVVEDFSESVDLLPTILDWLGIAVPHSCDGASLLPQLRDPAARGKDAAHFEFSLRPGFPRPKQRILDLDWRSCDLAVLRTAAYKYVHFQALPPLLFDLRDDPGELVDRSRDPAYRETMLAMAQRMLNWRMHHAERELVPFNASTEGLVSLV